MLMAAEAPIHIQHLPHPSKPWPMLEPSRSNVRSDHNLCVTKINTCHNNVFSQQHPLSRMCFNPAVLLRWQQCSGASPLMQHVGACSVTAYLALMVRGSSRLEVAFPALLPRLPLLAPLLPRLRSRLAAVPAS